jgi:hypothetical protein
VADDGDLAQRLRALVAAERVQSEKKRFGEPAKPEAIAPT